MKNRIKDDCIFKAWYWTDGEIIIETMYEIKNTGLEKINNVFDFIHIEFELHKLLY